MPLNRMLTLCVLLNKIKYCENRCVELKLKDQGYQGQYYQPTEK